METSARYGLKLLEWILPLCLVADNHYHPYFYYDHSTVSYYSDPLPYFILVEDFLLCLSQDLKSAVLYKSSELIQYYRQSISETINQCESLLTCSMDPFDILKQYMDYSTLDGYYTIMAQPCFGKFYSREFIASKVPKELPYYQELVDAADGSITGLIVNPSKFQIPEYLTFTISPDKGIHIFTTLMFEEKAYHSNMHILEPIISKAFFDFILSLPASEYVYSKEDTLKILDELIEHCS